MLFKLAWRNIWRRPRRTAITLVSIVFGTALCLFFTGISDGMYGRVISMAVKIGSGHLTLENPAYRDDPGLEHVLIVGDELLASARAQRGVDTVSARISSAAIISSARGTVAGRFDAFVPTIEEPISPLATSLVDGRFLEGGNDVIIGVGLARKLDAELGTKLVVTAQDRSGETTQELFRVAGIFETRAAMLDGFYFQIPLERAQQMLALDADEVTQVGIYLDDIGSMKRVSRLLERSVAASQAEIEVVPWQRVLEDLSNYIELDQASNYIFQVLLFVVILAGVLNTVLMSVMERSYEFGVMLSVGMKSSKLTALVALESALLAIIGTGLGAIVGWVENQIFLRYPIDLSSAVSEDLSVGGFYIELSLQMNLTTFHYLFTLAAVFVGVLLVGVYPAWKAGTVEPVEVLQTI